MGSDVEDARDWASESFCMSRSDAAAVAGAARVLRMVGGEKGGPLPTSPNPAVTSSQLFLAPSLPPTRPPGVHTNSCGISVVLLTNPYGVFTPPPIVSSDHPVWCPHTIPRRVFSQTPSCFRTTSRRFVSPLPVLSSHHPTWCLLTTPCGVFTPPPVVSSTQPLRCLHPPKIRAHVVSSDRLSIFTQTPVVSSQQACGVFTLHVVSLHRLYCVDFTTPPAMSSYHHDILDPTPVVSSQRPRWSIHIICGRFTPFVVCSPLPIHLCTADRCPLTSE